MSVVLYAHLLVCDMCGAQSKTTVLPGPLGLPEEILAEGWRDLLHTRMTDIQGRGIRHLCPVCLARPAGDLIGFLNKPAEPVTP